MLRNRAGKRCFGNGANNGVNFLAALEHHQRGDAADPVLTGDVWVLVGIELEDFDLAFEFLGNLVNNRSHHAAGTTPGSPEVNQDRNVTLKDILFKGCVGYSGSAGHSVCRRYQVNLATTTQDFSESSGALQNCDGFKLRLSRDSDTVRRRQKAQTRRAGGCEECVGRSPHALRLRLICPFLTAVLFDTPSPL